MNPWLVSIPIAYLLGSIPFGYILVLTFRHEDIRATGSGNIGATNVARSGAKGLAILTLFLDCLKGFVAVLLVFIVAKHVRSFHLSVVLDYLQMNQLACAAAIAAVIGHVFPVWLGFRGGKGVATALGVFLALSPAAIGVALLVFIVVFAISRYVSLASVLSSAAIPIAYPFFVHNRSPWSLAAFVGIPLLVVVKHHANIGRLISGTESRFGKKASA
jgi:acyl phosphate:glycerol-3-phosphate acyltransferase